MSHPLAPRGDRIVQAPAGLRRAGHEAEPVALPDVTSPPASALYRSTESTAGAATSTVGGRGAAKAARIWGRLAPIADPNTDPNTDPTDPPEAA